MQAGHGVDVTLGAVRVAYVAPEHLEAAANPDEGLASRRVRFGHWVPSVLPEPEEIGNSVLAARQNQHVGGTRFFGPPGVVENYAGHVFERGKLREVGKVRQPNHAHAQAIFAVGRGSAGATFERNTIFIVNAVIVQIRNDTETRLRQTFLQVINTRGEKAYVAAKLIDKKATEPGPPFRPHPSV